MPQKRVVQHIPTYTTINGRQNSIGEGINTNWHILWDSSLPFLKVELSKNGIIPWAQFGFEGDILLIMRKDSSNIFERLLIVLGQNDCGSSQLFLFVYWSGWSLMKFDKILVFFDYVESPITSSLLERSIAFWNVITALLHVGDMSLPEVFAIVAKCNEKDSIVVNRAVL